MNYVDTFITVADDCHVGEVVVPPDNRVKKSIARIQFELLYANPYLYTQEDVQFETFMRRKDTKPRSCEGDDAVRKTFFETPQACLRSSPLSKMYGWGLHFDRHGRIALYAIESLVYRRYAAARDVTLLKALSSKSRMGVPGRAEPAATASA